MRWSGVAMAGWCWSGGGGGCRGAGLSSASGNSCCSSAAEIAANGSGARVSCLLGLRRDFSEVAGDDATNESRY